MIFLFADMPCQDFLQEYVRLVLVLLLQYVKQVILPNQVIAMGHVQTINAFFQVQTPR